MTTTEKNILIDEFMGISHKSEFIQHKGEWRMSYSTYGSNWNELMPVVEKIDSMDYWTEICNSPLGTKTRPNRLMWCEIGKDNHRELLLDDCYTRIARAEASTKIEAVYNAVYQFILWFNSQQNKTQ